MRNFRQCIPTAVSGLLILVFVYTALSKLLHQPLFLASLAAIPLTRPWAPLLSWGVPAAELAVAALLIVPHTRRAGLLSALLLMCCFTAYVAYVGFISAERPCTCGGIVNSLSWAQHFWFNLMVSLAAALAFRLQHPTKKVIAINRGRQKPVEKSRPFLTLNQKP